MFKPQTIKTELKTSFFINVCHENIISEQLSTCNGAVKSDSSTYIKRTVTSQWDSCYPIMKIAHDTCITRNVKYYAPFLSWRISFSDVVTWNVTFPMSLKRLGVPPVGLTKNERLYHLTAIRSILSTSTCFKQERNLFLYKHGSCWVLLFPSNSLILILIFASKNT